jgi:hypothetical protein
MSSGDIRQQARKLFLYGTPSRRPEDNININFKEAEYENVGLIQLVLDRSSGGLL